MWSNSLWEQEHQEELYQAFMEECLSGGPENFISPVRQIVCGGCGRLFYTRVHSKKYCNDNCAKQGFWRHKRERRLEKRRDVQGLRRRFHAQTRRRCLLLQRLSPKGIPAERCGQW